MSLEAKQIHPAVQKALYRKIDALNRLELGTNKPFHRTSTALDVKGQSNPIEQQMARMCWARVTAAVIDPNVTGLDGLNDQPIYFSSFIEQADNRDIKNANRPLTYNEESSQLGESVENIYRGETGITQVQVDQLSFFIKKMTISFACPDPIDFEKRIQPIFLRHGQYCAVEFGWGMNDSDIEAPPLSFDDIQKLNSSIKERNLASSGNYQCDVGLVSNYTFSLNTDGGYEGTIDIITRGQNVLNQTSQNDDISREVLSVKSSVDDLRFLKKQLTDNPDELPENINEELIDNELRQIQNAKTTFKKTMLQLEDVIDKYLTNVVEQEQTLNQYSEDYTAINKTTNKIFSLAKAVQDIVPNDDALKNAYADVTGRLGSIKYKFKNGVLKTKPSSYFAPQNPKAAENTLISWGWFEDHILNSFFSIDVKITKDGKAGEKYQPLQSVRSISNQTGVTNVGGDDLDLDLKSTTSMPNRCHISNNLYSKGLDSVILPGMTHKSAKDPSEIDALLLKNGRNPQLRMITVRAMYEIIDSKTFKSFKAEGLVNTKAIETIGKDDVTGEDINIYTEDYIENPDKYSSEQGIIRNMVFPIGKFKEYFTNMETLKQGLRSFWADVQNEYGGYWAFGVGQDQDNTGRIGIYDIYYNSEAEKVDLFVSDNQSTREEFINYKYNRFENEDHTLSTDKTEKIFTFPLYSKNSIVKDFNLTVKMSSKAATIATYGGNTNLATGTQRSSDYTDLSLQAYSLLLNHTKEAETAGELKEIRNRLKEGIVTDMEFPINDDNKGTAILAYNKDNPLEIGSITQDGINFSDIEPSKETKEVIEKILQLQGGVADSTERYYWYNDRTPGLTRFYNDDGNMKSEYVRTMLFLINNSLYIGDESNIQTIKPVIPIDIDMTIDGVGGLKPFDLFRVDYLPEVYRNFTYFQVFNVGHTITPSGWETSITAKMKLDIDKYKQRYGKQFLKDKIDFEKVATEFRTKEQVESARKRIDKLIYLIQQNNRNIKRYTAEIEINTNPEFVKKGKDSIFLVDINPNGKIDYTDLNTTSALPLDEARKLGVMTGNPNRFLISVGSKNKSGVQALRNLIEIKERENREYQLEIDSLQPDRKGLLNITDAERNQETIDNFLNRDNLIDKYS